MTIRRNSRILKELQIPKTIDAAKTTQFLLEITVGGEIILYTSQYQDRPLIMTHDPNPLPLRYISFGAYVEYFYDCKKDAPFQVMPKHPLLNTNLLAKIDAEERKFSQHFLRSQNVPYNQIDLNFLSRRNGEILQTR